MSSFEENTLLDFLYLDVSGISQVSFFFLTEPNAPIRTGVTADLDPRGFGPPGPNPLADLEPPSQIWTPHKTFLFPNLF